MSPVTITPLINIKQCGDCPDPNIALYFDGYDYRYYLHVSGSDIVTTNVPLAYIPEDDWRNHLQFSYSYYSPDSTDGGAAPSKEEDETEAVDEVAGKVELDVRSSGDSGIQSCLEDAPVDFDAENSVVGTKTPENGPNDCNHLDPSESGGCSPSLSIRA